MAPRLLFPAAAGSDAGITFSTRINPMPSSAARRLSLVLACAAVPLFAGAARAQTPLALEVRGGIALPREAFTDDAGADGGYSTELSVTIGVLPFVGVYGAWQRAELSREGSESSVITDEGWAAGVRVSVPTPFIPIDPWIRGGVVVHELEAGGLDGGGDRGVGVEVAGGLRFSVGNRLALTPGVTWTRYGFDDETVDDGEVNVSLLRVQVGLRLGL
jgi:hypothetical protein